jgi:MinD-like ATPase involved in chromosome partitioning or flagellar assembly
MCKTIGVLSLKGGVGKTSSVVSLGASLSNLGKKVLLIDANFSAPNLGLHLNVIDPEITLHSVLEDKANPKEAIKTLSNFDLIPASFFGNSTLNYFKLRDKIKSLKRDYDVILIDSPPSLNEETLAVINASDEVLFVTTPDHSTLGTTLKSVKLVKEKGVSITGLILNKVHEKNFEISLEDIEDTIDVPIMARIPHDLKILKALSEFVPSTISNPNSKASEEYSKLAATLIGEKHSSNWLRSFFSKRSPKRPEINRTIYYQRVFK